mmetsp:Transcript_12131/g.41922  ORF Transcript_12131/g.41922 Transcript_12131/m.41922 type:complete len:264 (-) Transcript_12131:323-1114(-)
MRTIGGAPCSPGRPCPRHRSTPAVFSKSSTDARLGPLWRGEFVAGQRAVQRDVGERPGVLRLLPPGEVVLQHLRPVFLVAVPRRALWILAVGAGAGDLSPVCAEDVEHQSFRSYVVLDEDNFRRRVRVDELFHGSICRVEDPGRVVQDDVAAAFRKTVHQHGHGFFSHRPRRVVRQRKATQVHKYDVLGHVRALHSTQGVLQHEGEAPQLRLGVGGIFARVVENNDGPAPLVQRRGDAQLARARFHLNLRVVDAVRLPLEPPS